MDGRLQYALRDGVTRIVMQMYDATQTESLFRSPSVSLLKIGATFAQWMNNIYLCNNYS